MIHTTEARQAAYDARMEARQKQQLELLDALLVKHRREMPMFLPEQEMEYRLKCIKADVEDTFRAHGFVNMNVTIQLVDGRIDVFIEELPWYKEVSVQGVLDNTGKFTETKKPTKYDEALKILTTIYGEQVGTFLTNRFAGLIRKHVKDQDDKQTLNSLRVCKVGDSGSEAAYALVKHQGHGIECDETFTYQTCEASVMYMIGFNYNRYDHD